MYKCKYNVKDVMEKAEKLLVIAQNVEEEQFKTKKKHLKQILKKEWKMANKLYLEGKVNKIQNIFQEM